MENSSDIARLFGAQQAAALASVQASSLAERKAALARFQAGLKQVEAVIVAENANRLYPYPYLQPSLIPTSINI